MGRIRRGCFASKALSFSVPGSEPAAFRQGRAQRKQSLVLKPTRGPGWTDVPWFGHDRPTDAVTFGPIP